MSRKFGLALVAASLLVAAAGVLVAPITLAAAAVPIILAVAFTAEPRNWLQTHPRSISETRRAGLA